MKILNLEWEGRKAGWLDAGDITRKDVMTDWWSFQWKEKNERYLVVYVTGRINS